MITLSIDASVLIALKKAMPKTNKAKLALEKYKEVLKQLIEHSLMDMDDNMFRFFGQFLVSTHQLELETGQFVIDGKKQYLHKWLKLNGLSLIKVVKLGLKGSDVSSVKLTHLVTMTDAMDLKVLRQPSPGSSNQSPTKMTLSSRKKLLRSKKRSKHTQMLNAEVNSLAAF